MQTTTQTNETAIIPAFTQSDFLNTVKPYEYLYSFAENKFELGQMRERMKTYAASIGVKGFIGLWNAYVESRRSKSGYVPTANATEFDGQELELFCAGYTCDEYGVMLTDRYGYEKAVCRHPIMPVRRLVNLDTGEERLEIAFKKGYTWRRVIVEKSVIASASSILSLAAKGVLVTTENARDLSTYLLEMEQLNYDIIPESRSVSRLGWITGDEFSPYLDDIGFDGDALFRQMYDTVKPHGDPDKWLAVMREMRAQKGAGRIFLAASFASVLVKPLGLLPFFAHAFGKTTTGKTVGLMVAASVWANPAVGEYITTFNSTAVGQETMAIFLNSLPMCIDELQIREAGGERDFDEILYKLTEGKGKIRGERNGGLRRTGTWANCFITSGERPITSHTSKGGALNRAIEFEITEKIYPDLRQLCAIITQNYGFAGKDFVDIIRQPGALEYAKNLFEVYFAKVQQAGATEKQASPVAAILVADAIATMHIFKDDALLTVEDFREIIKTDEEVSANQRAYEYLCELPARFPNRFETDKYNEYRGECWGKIGVGEIYVIKSVFDAEMTNEGYSPSMFLSWAARCDKIRKGSDGKRTVVARIGNRSVRCVAIKTAPEEGDQMTL